MVLSYYEYLWRNKRGVVPHGVYDRLPVVFQAEIAQATNSETILKVYTYLTFLLKLIKIMEMLK